MLIKIYFDYGYVEFENEMRIIENPTLSEDELSDLIKNYMDEGNNISFDEIIEMLAKHNIIAEEVNYNIII